MTMVDIRLNIETLSPLELQESYFFRPIYGHIVQSRYRMFLPFVKFSVSEVSLGCILFSQSRVDICINRKDCYSVIVEVVIHMTDIPTV